MIMLFRWIARIGGLVALVLGIMISRSPVMRLHMTIGMIVAADLAIVGAWAIAKSVRRPAGAAGLVWALGMVRLGLMQTQVSGARIHTFVSVAHILMGIGAIGLVEMLVAGIVKRGSVS